VARDVDIDRAQLEQAALILDGALGGYRAHIEDTWRRDTGVGDPCGRTLLRVMLENAIGAALVRARTETDDGLQLGEQLRTIVDSFASLDASLGDGWDADYVADLS